MKEIRLLPQPRSIEVAPGGRRVDINEAAKRGPAERLDPSLPPQGYRLSVDDEVVLAYSDDAGRRYGHSTLGQLRVDANESPAGAPVCTIVDWPDLAVRGVMIDVSRDKVPTLETLFAIAERLSAWKINHLQLYMEHTFATRGHEEVWRKADPYTAEDLRKLDAHCASLGIMLVPNQNTLGHFDRWLIHDRYRALAIAPEGFEFFGMRRGPATLDPANPGSLALVSDIVSQLAPVLPGRAFHIGLDEPWELPRERRGEWADWLDQMRSLSDLQDRELLVWGDVPAVDPELLRRIPEGTTVCEWGYEENHPFEDRSLRLRDCGVPFWLCPGTSSWLSITGRVENMIGNVRSAVDAAVDHGASGLLVTDWGDMGHLQYLPSSEPGVAAAAAMSWCRATNSGLGTEELGRLLDRYCFDDPACEIGGGLVQLGKVHRMVTPQPFNLSALVMHVLLPQWRVGTGLTEGLDTNELEEVEAVLDSATEAVHRARPRRSDGALVACELEASARLLALASRDARARLQADGRIESVDSSTRKVLADELGDLIAEHRRLWLSRNRQGGLDDSVAWLENLRSAYVTGHTEPGWFGPLA